MEHAPSRFVHAPPTPPAPAEPAPLAALLHRWFVEYNPTYLFSAALVLAGLTLVSCDLADADALAGVGLTGVAEIYALMLIAGAALLVRIGQRRVGVMVGLLAALYQCDLTMHTETCAYLGGLGWALAITWAALFHVKLRLLARALQLTPSLAALAIPSLGALGVALLPLMLRELDRDARPLLVAVLVFAVGASALWSKRSIQSAAGYDYRGRRAIRGTWLMWAALALAHVLYASFTLGVSLWALAPVAIVLGTRSAQRERTVWIACAFALGLAPVPLVAAMVSVVLVLRALRAPTMTVPTSAEAAAPAPYRGIPSEPEPEPIAAPETTFAHATPVAMERLLAGAFTSAHFALWSALTVPTLWRTHVLWLDLALAVVLGLMFWRARRVQPLVPAAALATHLAITIGWLRAPHHAADWGIWSIGIGFAMLGGSLLASWWIARPREPAS